MDKVERSWEWRALRDDRNTFSVYTPPDAGASRDTADLDRGQRI